jgi:transcriptional regulator of arginine metabolism
VSRVNGNVKARRQRAILGLVEDERLGSQGEIRERLAALGIDATQSTISRDIEELGLARIHAEGVVRYVVPGEAPGPRPIGLLRRLLDEFAVAITRTSAGLVVRTPPGAAAALAEGIDRAALPEVAGTIAGDNTILILGHEGVRPARLEAVLERIREENA